MIQNLAVELVAENDFIFKAAGQHLLIWILRIPNAGLAHEVEPAMLHHRRLPPLRVGFDYLEQELAVSAFVQARPLRRSFYREPTQDERP